jgi:hypothetical protein
LTKGGWEIWYTPAPKISTPFTSSEMPMKNQMEIVPSDRMGLTRK